MSVYEEGLLKDIVSLRARHASRLKETAYYISQQVYYGVSRNVVCYQLSALYNQVATLLADIEKTGFEIGKYVGTRLVARLEQITTSAYALAELLRMSFVSYDVYLYTKRLLDYESLVVYRRWERFEQMLKYNLVNLYDTVLDVLSYIGELMKTICG